MINRLPIKILLTALAALALLWLLFAGQSKKAEVDGQASQGNPSTLVSSIQPIAEANATAPGVASGSLNVRTKANQIDSLNDDDLIDLTRRFDAANSAIDSGQMQSAIRDLESITSDFPSVVEPYLNLASIYAEQQQLEKARATLLKGFDANPKAGLLFDHLKKVHGALAASSYRQAIDTSTSSNSAVKITLSRASSIVTQLDQSNKIAALQKQVKDKQSQAETVVNESQAKKILALENKLKEVESSNLTEQAGFEQSLGGLKKQLAEQSQALLLSQAAEREALARVVRAEQDASNKIAEINKELALQQASLLVSQALVSQQSDALAKAEQQSQTLALREIESVKLAKEAKNAADLAAATVKINDDEIDVDLGLSQQELEQKAIGLVQSWAAAWSAQDVPAYVSHYADNYSSSRSIARAQWLEQRHLRLTNKEFINVKVSGFKVKDLGAQFSVTFAQYYQSNTVDDTVTKRLIFNKSGDGWSDSKIVNERLVSS